MKKTVILALSFIMVAAVVQAQPGPERYENWHQWRGPDANGSAPKAEPPIAWDAKTNIKWKAELPGRGSATPIVWGDQVFVLAAIKTDRTVDSNKLPKADPRFKRKTTAPTNVYQFVVLSFDRNTGNLRWKQTATEQVPHEGHHETHSFAGGSPTTDGKFLYFSFGSRGTYCYDLAGNLKWKRDIGRMNTRLGWGEAVTPVVHGDSLVLNWDQEADSAVICLNAKTGETRWKKERDEPTSWNTPLVVEHEGQVQVIVNGKNRVRSYKLENGDLLWECGGMTLNAIPSPVAANGVVYCVSGYRGAAAFAIPLSARGDLTESNKVIWRINKGTPYVPSPLLLGDRLIFTQANMAILTSLDIKTGKVMLDRERLPNQKSFYASPVAAAGRIYLVDRDGTTLVLKQGDKFEVLATNRLGDAVDASPALAGKQLFLRGEKYLYCIEAK